MRNFLTSLLLVTLVHLSSNAQHFTHDVGFHIGTSTMQTDYGVRNDFLSSYGNSAISLSFTHTLHFFNKDLRWNADHKIWSYLALRSELNIITNKEFIHYGEFVNENSPTGEQLRAMSGATRVMSIGISIRILPQVFERFYLSMVRY